MTVNYTAQVATCTYFGCFVKLLIRWRGSIYKIIWRDMIAYLVLYYTLAFVYRFVLNAEGRHIFENIKHYCSNNSLIPIAFVLGFYVSMIMKRWWNQYLLIPRPDATAVLVSSLIQGHDVRDRIIRRTIVRYLCFAFTMTLRSLSPSVKKRFPTWDHFIDAGFLAETEKEIVLRVKKLLPRQHKFWIPIIWAVGIVTRARHEGRIRDDFAQTSIITEIDKFRSKCSRLIYYDAIGIPLVYTQVVTLAVYSYFICNIVDDQWVDIQDEEGYDPWMRKFFPIFSLLELFFYMGWLKVAETLINPFGEDDDDFEVNWLIDRNLQVSYLIVDEMHQEHPELMRDQYWDEVCPARLAALHKQGARYEPPEASTAKIGLAKESFSVFGPLSSFISRQSSARVTFSNIQSKFNFSTTDSRQVGVVNPQPHEYNARKYTHSRMRSVEFQAESRSSSGTLVQDDFDLLRTEREKERLRRQQIKLLRAVENLTHVKNVAAIMSIRPVRHLAVSDSEKSLADTEDELEVVADTKEKQKASKQRDALDRLKEDRSQRRQHRQKHSLAKTVAELNDTANAAKILVRKKSAKKIALADQSEDTAAAKQSDQAKDSTSTTSLSKESESVLCTTFFLKLFKPKADSAARAEQVPSPSKLPVDVKKVASTATLVPVEQTASTSSPSWILNDDSSAATLYFDPSSASTLEVDEDIKEVPAQTTVRLTQGRNLLHVDSDESIYFDPSEITLVASEENLKKKESKSKK